MVEWRVDRSPRGLNTRHMKLYRAMLYQQTATLTLKSVRTYMFDPTMYMMSMSTTNGE